MTDLGRTFRHLGDQSALAIDDADEPVFGDVRRTEEGEEFSGSDVNGQTTEGLTVLEDWDFDIGNPILDNRLCKTSDTTIELFASARCWASIANGLRRGRRSPGWTKVLMELSAIHIGNHNPRPSLFRKFTACLSLESVEVVVKQRRCAGQRFRERNELAELGIDARCDRPGGIEKALALRVVGPADEAPDHSDDDEVERHSQDEHEQDRRPEMLKWLSAALQDRYGDAGAPFGMVKCATG